MKGDREHRVPLSGRSLELLGQARKLGEGRGLVFPGRSGWPMSDMTLSKLLKDLGNPAVPHGFRFSFRDWAAEQTETPQAVMEAG